MWPKLSNIEDSIYINLTSDVSSSKNGFNASQRMAWVRVFSGAVVAEHDSTKDTVIKGSDGKDTIKKGTKPRSGLILSSVNKSDVFKGTTEFTSTYGDSVSSGDMGLSWDGRPISSGVGAPLRPSPIITGLEIKEGKDQISRECTLTMKAFSLAQMEKMQTYFLEPGYSLCIEYGWNSINGIKSAINTGDKNRSILSQATNINLDYNKLHDIRVKSAGDYDSFLGFIVGGTVSSDGDKWTVSVKLRGAPGLPTFLQTQNKSLQIDSKGDIVDKPGEPKPYGVSETEAEGSGEIRRDRRFKNMFNQLPSQRQTEQVRKLMGPTDWDSYLNLDAAVNKSITTYANPGWVSRVFGGASNEIKVGKSTIEKEKLFSKNKYIKFELAVKILNANSEFTAYRMGGKDLSVEFDISRAKIGAFPNMFSTKASKLVIPGFMPDFSVYFLNEGQVDQLKGGILRSDGKEYPIVRNVIPGQPIQFVEQTDLNEDGLVEKSGYWGYLKNLYINFDLFVEKLTQKNKNIREVFLDMLNEMSSAVNSFWNFQIVEETVNTGKPVKGKPTASKIIITVIDENWVGGNPDDKTKVFYHSGPKSIFLDASLDISVPSEMTNQIISRRLALANNPDEPIVGVGGFFNSQTDLFLNDITDADGKPRKKISAEQKAAEDEAKKEEQKEAEKQPHEKMQEDIAANQGAVEEARKAKKDKKVELDNLKAQLDKVDGNESPFFTDEKLNPTEKARLEKLVKEKKAEIDALDKSISDINKEIEKKRDEVKEQKEKDEKDAEENKKTALSNNLAKIDVLPKPELASLNPDKITGIANADELKKIFVIYCLNDEPFFDRMKNDAFSAKKGNGNTTLSHPLPIKYNFKIMGTSGIRRGDTFNINGIPSKYTKHGLFQVTQIEQSVENMLWTTNVTGEYRQKQ
jgi:hypothetical protein